MRTTAVWQSVMFAASQKPRSLWAFSTTSCGSALMGGPSSAVTAGLPLAITFSRVLPLFIETSKDRTFSATEVTEDTEKIDAS
jgi:hypothetical protein